MAQQTDTQAAGSVPAIPDSDHPHFWAAHAVRDDVLWRELKHGWISVMECKALEPAYLLAYRTAEVLLMRERNRCFEEAKKDGALLMAWEGSTALEGGAA